MQNHIIISWGRYCVEHCRRLSAIVRKKLFKSVFQIIPGSATTVRTEKLFFSTKFYTITADLISILVALNSLLRLVVYFLCNPRFREQFMQLFFHSTLFFHPSFTLCLYQNMFFLSSLQIHTQWNNIISSNCSEIESILDGIGLVISIIHWYAIFIPAQIISSCFLAKSKST